MATLESVIAAISSLGTRVVARLDALETRVDACFSAVDARFSAVEARFSALEARVETGLATADVHYQAVVARLDVIDARLDVIETRSSALENRVDELLSFKPIFEKAGDTFEIVARSELRRKYGDEYARQFTIVDLPGLAQLAAENNHPGWHDRRVLESSRNHR